MELFDILTFDREIVESVDITTTDPDWTDLITLSVPDMVAGDYALAFSLQFWHNTTSQAFLYRFSLDGGSTWGPAYEKEVKDRNNTEVIEVSDLLVHIGGTIQVSVQVTKGGTADCTVNKGIIVCERKA